MAETRAPFARKIAGSDVKRTVCCFCSCGCGMLAFVRRDESGRESLRGLEGDPANPINEGTLCSKGAAAAGLWRADDRLRKPRVRRARGADWEEASWEEAIAVIAGKLAEIRGESWSAEARRTEAIGLMGGAVNTNEEAYLFRKLAALLGTPWVEHQARV